MYDTNVLPVEILRSAPLFDSLPASSLEQLASNCQKFRYRIGQPILRHKTLPNQVFIILEGYVRLLGYQPGSQKPFTLQRLGPGDALGWIGLLRSIACETAIASEETTCLAIAGQTFLSVLRAQPDWQQRLSQETTPAELYQLLVGIVQQQANNRFDLQELTLTAAEQAHCLSLEQGKPFDTALELDFTWFLSSHGVDDAEPGDRIDVTRLELLLQQAQHPLRLVGIPQALLESSSSEPAAAALGTQQIAGDRAAASEIPYGPREPEEPDFEVFEVDARQRQTYPFVRGRGPLRANLACLQMLAQFFNMPFRRDILRRVLADQLQRTGSIPLPVSGAIAEMMGLRAQMLAVPGDQVHRLPTPVLLQWQDSLAILYKASQRELIIAAPEEGLLKRTPQEFESTWTGDGQVILLQTTKATPQEKFGIQWFLPALKKHLGVLVTVLAASFFVQLFALANPLIVQVIIDRVIVRNSPDTLGILGFLMVAVAVFEAVLMTLRTYLFVD
ncbi:MAG: cyclic nucleotide-binding domain-containing protein, partial [Cyanobacteria bacterium P01_H01_bin.121]